MPPRENFLGPEEHLNHLVEDLPPEVAKLYRRCRNTRLETCYRNRNFVVYRMDGDHPEVLDRIVVEDFEASEAEGTTSEITSRSFGRIVLRYAPQQLGNLPVLLFLPLHAKLRWSASPLSVPRGILGFPIAIRTLSRLNLHEPGIVYCETAQSFDSEFATKVR